MRKLNLLLLTIAAFLTACGSSDGTIIADAGGPGGTADVASVTMLTSNPSIQSDGSNPVTITALVRDVDNNVMEGIPVLFSADSGSLIVNQPVTTDDTGIVSATLSTAGDPTTRLISVTGAAGSAADAVTVTVAGTILTLDGPRSLPINSTDVPYTVTLSSVGGVFVGETVSVTSSAGNPIALANPITNSQGTVTFLLTANVAGVDTLTATALGETTTLDVNVSNDVFSFTQPDASNPANLDVPISTALHAVEVQWLTAGVPRDGELVTFTTTRGTIVGPNPAAAAGGGFAKVDVSAAAAGPAVLTATNADGTSIQLSVSFVADTPDTIELQASPTTIGTDEQASITATIRDLAGNRVKGQVVTFVLSDVTGGAIFPAQVVTDDLGRAQTVYTASTVTSALDGVSVTASVGNPPISNSVQLTVAQRELFVSLGTGNSIIEPNEAQYKVVYAVQVTDATGAGVDGAVVNLSVLSTRFWEGTRTFPAGGSSWVTNQVPPAGCPDEDLDRDGILDAGEDTDGNGLIDAGNIASVSVQGTGGGTLVTDENGFGLVDIFYPQEYAYWLEVVLEARTPVQGTAFSGSQTFLLTGSTLDFGSEDTSPPGLISPFGIDGNCLTPD